MLINPKTAKVLKYIKEKTKDGSFLEASLDEIGKAIDLPAYQVSRELIKLKSAGVVESFRTFRNQPTRYRYVGTEAIDGESIETFPASPALTIDSVLNSLPKSVRTTIEHYLKINEQMLRLQEENLELRKEIERLKSGKEK